MKDLKVTFKNVPEEVIVMFEIAFQTVPAHVGEKQIAIPADGLEIDFEKTTDNDLFNDLIGALHILVMAHSWIALKQRENER